MHEWQFRSRDGFPWTRRRHVKKSSTATRVDDVVYAKCRSPPSGESGPGCFASAIPLSSPAPVLLHLLSESFASTMAFFSSSPASFANFRTISKEYLLIAIPRCRLSYLKEWIYLPQKGQKIVGLMGFAPSHAPEDYQARDLVNKHSRDLTKSDSHAAANLQLLRKGQQGV